jgi:hypothetical protein
MLIFSKYLSILRVMITLEEQLKEKIIKKCFRRLAVREALTELNVLETMPEEAIEEAEDELNAMLDPNEYLISHKASKYLRNQAIPKSELLKILKSCPTKVQKTSYSMLYDYYLEEWFLIKGV